MNLTTGVAIAACIVFATLVGRAFVKTTASQFQNDPAEDSYHGAEARDKSSEKAQDTADRQREMMERMNDRINRNK